MPVEALLDERREQLEHWVQTQLRSSTPETPMQGSLEVASADASFRRYFRARTAQHTFIAVDAPPPQEQLEPFISIAQRWRGAGVRVPEVIDSDTEKGFMLLEDFGDRQLQAELERGGVDYASAFETLVQIQRMPAEDLPPYDESVLQREMNLFPEWFLGQLLGLSTDFARSELENVYAELIRSAQAQPQVCVHRDYHSRNLMPLNDGGLGVIDFQDALIGPVTYDLVSLLRDSYIDWPDAQVYDWVEQYRLRLLSVGFELPDSVEFKRAFDLMGMQRQLKVLGIFSRLWLRDGKAGYLKDIPRTFFYLLNAARQYPEFSELVRLLEALLPQLREHPALASLPERSWNRLCAQ